MCVDKLFERIALLLDTTYKNKLVDKMFLFGLFNEIMIFQKTKKYLSGGFRYGEYATVIFRGAFYDVKKKELIVCREEVRNAEYNVAIDLGDISEEQRFFATNILLVLDMFRAMEGANQWRKRDEEETYEAKLLKLSVGQDESLETFDVVPDERMAEFYAIKKTLRILEYSKTEIKELKAYLERRLNYSLILGYIVKDSEAQTYPLKEYCLAHKIPHEEISLEEILESCDSLEKRLFYGLPISAQEFKETKKKAGLK